MSLLAVTAIRLAELPPPPSPGGGAGDDVWWRVAGIVLVSLIAIVLFLYIFRPLTPKPAGGVDEQQREDEELARLAARIGADTDETPASVIPFRSRAQTAEAVSQTEVSNAQARLRRILGQSAQGDTADRSDRRRLGDRRGDPSPSQPCTEPGVDAPSQPAPDEAISKSETGMREVHETQGEDGDVVTTTKDDIWGDLGEIGNRLPSEADRKLLKDQAGDSEADLFTEQAGIRPLEAEGTSEAEESAVAPPRTLNGNAPSEQDISRMVEETRTAGKIVPFVRRTPERAGALGPATPADTDDVYRLLDVAGPTPTPAQVMPITVDSQTREAIEAVIRQLLFYANVGEVLQGFGLYTDEHLHRFMAESGMPEEEFQALFAAIPPKRPEEWTRIEFISRVVRMQDGRISADVQYVDGHQPNGKERLTFVQDPSTKRWLIDDIEAI